MTVSLYTATVSAYLQVLPAIAGMIAKAEAHGRDHALPESALVTAALAPDMWDFAKQIRAVCMHSAGAIEGAIAGELAPDMTAPPADLAGLGAMVQTAIKRLEAVPPAQVDALVGQDTVFRFGERRMDFLAEDLLLTFSVPNFYFHAGAAYAILRAQGLSISKGDFLGKPRLKMPD